MAGPRDLLGQLDIGGGDDRRGGLALSDFARQVRAGEHGDATVGHTRGIGNDLVDALEGAQFEALSQGQQGHVGHEGLPCGFQCRAHSLDGDGNDDQRLTCHRLCDIRRGRNTLRQRDARQIRRVFATVDKRNRVGVAPPHGDVHARIRKHLSECRTPRSRSQDRCCCHTHRDLPVQLSLLGWENCHTPWRGFVSPSCRSHRRARRRNPRARRLHARVPAGAGEHTARPGLVRSGLLPHPPVGCNRRGERAGPGRDKADQRGHLDVVEPGTSPSSSRPWQPSWRP